MTSVAFRVAIEDQPLGYHPLLARVCGSLAAGVVLGRLLYWDGVMSRKRGGEYTGEFWKSDHEIADETGLSPCEVRTAKKKLLSLGFIKCTVHSPIRGASRTTHYRLQLTEIENAVKAGACGRQPKRLRGERGKFVKAKPRFAMDGESDSPRVDNQSAMDGESTRHQRQNVHYPTQDLTQNLTQEDGAKPSPPPKNICSESLFQLASALGVVCGFDFNANRGRLFAEAKRLARASPAPTADLILEKFSTGGWWSQTDWRGKQGERPKPEMVRECWGGWLLPERVPQGQRTASKLSDMDAALERRRRRQNGNGNDDREDSAIVLGDIPVGQG